MHVACKMSPFGLFFRFVLLLHNLEFSHAPALHLHAFGKAAYRSTLFMASIPANITCIERNALLLCLARIQFQVRTYMIHGDGGKALNEEEHAAPHRTP